MVCIAKIFNSFTLVDFLLIVISFVVPCVVSRTQKNKPNRDLEQNVTGVGGDKSSGKF